MLPSSVTKSQNWHDALSMTQYFQNFFHILYHRSFCFGNHFPFKWSEEKLQISWRLDSALFYISAYNNYLTSYFSDTISLSFFVLYSFICPNFKFTIFIKPISKEKIHYNEIHIWQIFSTLHSHMPHFLKIYF